MDHEQLTDLGVAVTACAFPALLLQVPSELMLAASPTAVALLSPEGSPLVGRGLEGFLGDEPSGALPLLMRGRLAGFETSRAVAGSAEPLTMWLRRIDDAPVPEHVVAILARVDPDRPRLLLEPPPPGRVGSSSVRPTPTWSWTGSAATLRTCSASDRTR